jgi:murein DD-endopeptidase MepM/ murein hydrolase activator NlpD
MELLPLLAHKKFWNLWLLLALVLGACATAPRVSMDPPSAPSAEVESAVQPILPTPLPTRPTYQPGERVDYSAQTGDTLPALAARFNTTIAEIRAANPIIPADATTLPPGLPMKIPIYYRPLWGTPYHILPDLAFVNGPAGIGFNTAAFVAAHNGWLKDYQAYAGGANRSGAGLVDYVAQNFSISPRLLLAILEYQSGALSNPEMPDTPYLLGHRQKYYENAYLQLVWAANTLNNGYYGWRAGSLIEFDLTDGSIFRPDPWQNAATVAIEYYFAQVLSAQEFALAIGPSGLAQTYQHLFGDPWQDERILIPGSLQQPALTLPFPAGQTWTFTGGPHTGWGSGAPFAALDFAPPSEYRGCFRVAGENYATAVADGLVVRSDVDGVVLDLDKDGDERTGWVIYYLHLAEEGRVPAGKEVHAGDPVGYPSCEGGHATGTHVHIARKYNGEWMLADGAVPFNLEGWVAHNGKQAYLGSLTRGSQTVIACECSDAQTKIKAEGKP